MRQIILLVLLLPGLANAEIYKWNASSGQIPFSETPVAMKKAEKVSAEVSSYGKLVAKNVSRNSSLTGSKVVMYATSWCPHCANARKYFKKNKIPYVEYDIEKSKQAKKKFDSIGGSGVPLILVGEKRLSGFSESEFEKLLDNNRRKGEHSSPRAGRGSSKQENESHRLE